MRHSVFCTWTLTVCKDPAVQAPELDCATLQAVQRLHLCKHAQEYQSWFSTGLPRCVYSGNRIVLAMLTTRQWHTVIVATMPSMEPLLRAMMAMSHLDAPTCNSSRV